MQQRPFGVAVLAIAAAVLGALAIIGAGGWWNASEALVWLPSIHAERFIALVLLVVGVTEVVFAYGAWRLRAWAWTLGAVLEVIALVLALLQLGRSDFGRHIVTIVLACIVLSYLATPRVRAAFGRS
jgi:uncharacterized membrane protein (DUF2068 family)